MSNEPTRTSAPHHPVPVSRPEPGGDLAPASEDRMLGMLTHLLAIFSSFVGPLIIWLLKREESTFVDHHGKESLNFQFTLLLIEVALLPVGVILGIVTAGLGFLLLIPLFIGIGIFALVVEILSCVRAHEGQWCRYPLTIRFLS